MRVESAPRGDVEAWIEGRRQENEKRLQAVFHCHWPIYDAEIPAEPMWTYQNCLRHRDLVLFELSVQLRQERVYEDAWTPALRALSLADTYVSEAWGNAQPVFCASFLYSALWEFGTLTKPGEGRPETAIRAIETLAGMEIPSSEWPRWIEAAWQAYRAIRWDDVRSPQRVDGYLRGVIFQKEKTLRAVYGSEGALGVRDLDELEISSRKASRMKSGDSWDRLERVDSEQIALIEADGSDPESTAPLLMADLEAVAHDELESHYFKLISGGWLKVDARAEAGLSRNKAQALERRAARRLAAK